MQEEIKIVLREGRGEAMYRTIQKVACSHSDMPRVWRMLSGKVNP